MTVVFVHMKKKKKILCLYAAHIYYFYYYLFIFWFIRNNKLSFGCELSVIARRQRTFFCLFTFWMQFLSLLLLFYLNYKIKRKKKMWKNEKIKFSRSKKKKMPCGNTFYCQCRLYFTLIPNSILYLNIYWKGFHTCVYILTL